MPSPVPFETFDLDMGCPTCGGRFVATVGPAMPGPISGSSVPTAASVITLPLGGPLVSMRRVNP